MASGVREVSVKKGYDPREFPLVVAGGAGPIHACEIAHELEIPVIIIPKESSIFCAAGMLMSDLKHDFVKTYAVRFDHMDTDVFQDLFGGMEEEGNRLLASENIDPGNIQQFFSLDLRYVKQYHEVTVPVTRQEIQDVNIDSMVAKFHPEHNRLYGYSLEREETPVELINMRLTMIGRTEKPRFMEEEYNGEDPSPALKDRREVYVPGLKQYREVNVYDGFSLRYGNIVNGPAIIEQVNTTTFVTPEYQVASDRYGSYTMYLKEREDEFRGRVFK